MTQDRTKMLISLAVTILLAISSVTASPAATEPGGATPEQVFERMRAAATGEDYEEMAACLSPSGRAEMSGMLLMVAGMAAAFSQMGAEMAGEMAQATGTTEQAAPPTSDLEANLNALLARHGLDESALGPPGASTEELPKQLESTEFFADIMTFVQEQPNDAEGQPGPGPTDGFSIPDGGLTNLEIDGDHASAQIGDEPAKFVRIEGRWYIDPDLTP